MVNQKRHFGLYGIYYNKALLVVKKTRGPYINRYDLPGGSLEEGSLKQNLKRELLEEVGADFDILEQVGLFDFFVDWQEDHLHHLAAFYIVQPKEDLVNQVQADDTGGYLFVGLDELNHRNSSPLVLKAKALLEGKQSMEMEIYNKWQINKKT